MVGAGTMGRGIAEVFAAKGIKITLYDAFPDAVLEALHAGCPVIASRIGGLQDILKYPELLFNLGDIQGIADCIENCISDASYYLRIRTLCAERASEFRFDWAKKFEQAMLNFGE